MYKSRSKFYRPGPQRAWWFYNGKVTVDKTQTVATVVTDTLQSQGNFWPPPKALRRFDMGNGAFIATSYKYEGTGDVSVSWKKYGLGGWDVRSVTGVLLPRAPQVPVPISPSNALMDKYGTDGFNATIPTKPLRQAAVFAGELRQLPQVSPVALKLMRDRAWFYTNQWRRWKHYVKDYTKASADEFLNQMFGWQPFLRDVADLLTPRVEVMQHINQLERDSGKKVRRRRTVAKNVSVTPMTSVPGGYGYPTGLADAQLAISQGTLLSHSVVREHAWFSASYTYYLPSATAGMGIPRAVAMARLINGVTINPDVLWNLAPWSWLADYGGNVGKVLSNLSAFTSDNLVATHAYVMVETQVTRDDALVNVGIRGGGKVSVYSSSTAVCKRRVRGTPFGFGFAGPLTTKQHAILIALGLSKL